MGQGQLAVLAAECANRGMDIDTTISAGNQLIRRRRSLALLHVLRYAVRGGRVPSWVKTVADLLRLKPVIATKPDGAISLAGFLFAGRDRVDRFARFIARRAPNDQAIRVAIGHAICETDAKMLESSIRSKIPAIKELSIDGLGPALGAHGGPDTLLVTVSPIVSLDDIAGGAD